MELNENMQKFVAALRSGEFPQAKGTLNRIDVLDSDEKLTVGYCCLGVGCELAARNGVVAKDSMKRYIDDTNYEEVVVFGILDEDSDELVESSAASYVYLPEVVADWLGFPGQTDLYFDMTDTPLAAMELPYIHDKKYRDTGKLFVAASDLNDRFNYTFDEIADLIESGKLVSRSEVMFHYGRFAF